MKILGLDVSTSNVGVCLVDTGVPQRDRVVLAYGIPLSKEKGLYTKSCMVRNELLRVAAKHNVDVVVVEESLQAFRSRMSSAGTIAKLNRFNGIVSFIARSEFGCPLHLANVVSTRKAVGCDLDRKSDLNTKEQVLKWVMAREEMESYVWPTKIMKSGKNKGETRFEPICYDIADAFVVAVWGADILKIEDLDDTNL